MDPLILKLLISGALGMLIGIEREKRKKPAGMRTHAILAMASTLMTFLSINAFPSNADPSRLIAAMVNGIGFIGIGTIIKMEDKVIGITTAASLLMTAGVGVAVGTGYYSLALAASLFTFLVLESKILEKKWIRR